jgi:hypothetical protein
VLPQGVECRVEARDEPGVAEVVSPPASIRTGDLVSTRSPGRQRIEQRQRPALQLHDVTEERPGSRLNRSAVVAVSQVCRVRRTGVAHCDILPGPGVADVAG